MPGWLPTHLTRAQLEERRLAALDWLQQDTHSYAQIAEPFGVSVHTVNSWKTRLKRKGTIQATVAPGPPSRLTPDQHAQLRTLLREGPLAYGHQDHPPRPGPDRPSLWSLVSQ
ncbi:hypothetical protein GCM10008957_39490 [Deinococcus ruber]|uniref:Transposase n=1 Tax=Deinococcus ruber TaxID=1848197 RepID=A0A918FA63_9DEIO|nr:hypothetical protein GCM10008957_39490 [Deinococcus ruber]